MKTAGQAVWTKVDRYFSDLLAPSDDRLDAALKGNAEAGLPQIDVSALQGKFLDFLVRGRTPLSCSQTLCTMVRRVPSKHNQFEATRPSWRGGRLRVPAEAVSC